MNRKHVWLGLQAIGTVVLLAVLFRGFDWARFGEVLRQMSPAFYFGSLLAIAAGQLLYAMRWRLVLAGIGVRVTYGEVLRQYFIGLFFSNVMPTAVGGDAAKVYYLGRRAGYVEIGASVFLDRFLGFLWLAVIGAALAWTVGGDSSTLVLNRNVLTVFAAGFLGALVVAAVVPVERLSTRFVPARWQGAAAAVGGFAGLVRRGALRPASLAGAGVVVATYALLVTVVYRQYFLANGLPAGPTAHVMLIVISMSIFINVPISLNGIGLREQLHVLLFTGLGIPKEVSVTISLLLFAHSIVLSLVGCVLWLKARPATLVPAA